MEHIVSCITSCLVSCAILRDDLSNFPLWLLFPLRPTAYRLSITTQNPAEQCLSRIHETRRTLKIDRSGYLSDFRRRTWLIKVIEEVHTLPRPLHHTFTFWREQLTHSRNQLSAYIPDPPDIFQSMEQRPVKA